MRCYVYEEVFVLDLVQHVVCENIFTPSSMNEVIVLVMYSFSSGI